MKLTILAGKYGKQRGNEARVQRRVEKRIPCNASKVRITAEGDLATVSGQVLDLSKSGLKLRTNKYFPLARKVVVEMDGLLIRGSIRYRRPQKGNPESFYMGLQIDTVASFPEFGSSL